MKSIVTAFHSWCVTYMMILFKLWCIYWYMCITDLWKLSTAFCCAWFVDIIGPTAFVHQPLWTKHTGHKHLWMHKEKNKYAKENTRYESSVSMYQCRWPYNIQLCLLSSYDVFFYVFIMSSVCCLPLILCVGLMDNYFQLALKHRCKFFNTGKIHCS